MSSNTVLWGRSRNDLIKLAITVLLPLFIFLGPTNDVFTADFRLFLVITLIAIISFATDSLPQTGVRSRCRWRMWCSALRRGMSFSQPG